jgi:hypothetical protein
MSDRENLYPASLKFATSSLCLGIMGWGINILQWCFDLTLGLVLAALTVGSSAVCGMILDILPVLLWVTSIVTGHVALYRIDHFDRRSRRRAIWGLTLSYVGLFFTILLIIVIIFLVATGIESGWFTKIIPQIHI